ncbi:hypothetical protein AVEN_115353-1 [Araneus ventricosus]|uniref:Uncharacterized protein n=1 Tax=Araneus ventricosus TaxID=182803 RepID=A0A4Y1ZY55_ARAVE|nr:hypothetical protein AVEN_115353-1 [Araneus ventricosus]
MPGPNSRFNTEFQMGSGSAILHIALNWFIILPQMKEHLLGTRFSSVDEEVKTAAKKRLNGQGHQFHQTSMNKLVLKSDKCLNRFEKVLC